MARGTNLAVWLDLQNTPLGQRSGENFGVASNYKVPPARVYVVNHSRTHAWKRVVKSASVWRGAEEVLIYDKKLAEVYNVDTLSRRIEQGHDMNRYKTEIHPVVYSFKVGGVTYAIPPAKDENAPPPRVEVKEGAWDLFLGNYDRMRGIRRDSRGDIVEGASDPQVISEERTRLAVYWRMRHNPVFQYADDTEKHEIENAYGFLEFIRVPVRAIEEPLDKEYLSALDLVEA